MRLRLVYVDFWSAVKLSFLAAVALAIVTIVSVFLVFMVIKTTGLIGKLDELFTAFDDNFTLSTYIDLPQVMAYLRKTCERYVELRPLARLLDQLESKPAEVAYTF